VAKVQEAKTSGTGIDKSNVNIVMKDNIVDNQIRFVGNEMDDNGCLLGDTYYLLSENEALPKNIIKNVSSKGETVFLNHTGERNGHVGLASNSFRQMKKSTVWKEVKGYFVRKNR
jgi:hypothetical protein